MHFPVEVLGFPPSFIGWFPSFTIIWDYHHPKKNSLPFVKMVTFTDFQGFFHFFILLTSLSSRMIVTIWCPWVSRLTRRMRGEGNEKAVGRRFFGRFVECAP